MILRQNKKCVKRRLFCIFMLLVDRHHMYYMLYMLSIVVIVILLVFHLALSLAKITLCNAVVEAANTAVKWEFCQELSLLHYICVLKVEYNTRWASFVVHMCFRRKLESKESTWHILLQQLKVWSCTFSQFKFAHKAENKQKKTLKVHLFPSWLTF